MQELTKKYLEALTSIIQRGDAREESFYSTLENLIKQLSEHFSKKNTEITILPRKTEAGNPDFRIWDGAFDIVGYIEAKQPGTNLDKIETSEQLTRYRETFPNLILTDFYEFRLYRNGEMIDKIQVARPFIAKKLEQTPPIENSDKFLQLWQRFLDFTLPKAYNSQTLAIELAKRTSFLANLILNEELNNNPHSEINGFYDAFKNSLIRTLTHKQFSDLYAQTVTYGLFASRTRTNGHFNRELAFKYIPQSIGILHNVFKFISLGDLSPQMQVIIDEIAQVLNIAEIKKILQEYYKQGKGEDPILHFYETFLAEYDPNIREKRGVYYTPEAVVKFIIEAVNIILKQDFDLPEGLGNEKVKLLDPAAGTMTFPAKAIETAVKEHIDNWGKGDLNNWLRKHILENFFAFELMMASYAIGHLKIGFILEELGLQLVDNERFKLYLTNSLELEEIQQTDLPFMRSLSAESRAANKIKRQENVLVIVGNPPYSGHSANTNDWTERLMKNDIINGVEIQSYYKIDGKDLGEKNPKWLQDDYVKFLRFAQWKIAQAGFGVVAMITNHSYLDNPTFRGMRQSLMKTFDEIYIVNLHGNSLKKESSPTGEKDENVFDIRQGVAIVILVKKKVASQTKKIFYKDLYGTRQEKNNWLNINNFNKKLYQEIKPKSPYYFFVKRDTEHIQNYLKWQKINEIFPVNSVGIVTGRDNFAIANSREELISRLKIFGNLELPDEVIRKTFDLKDTGTWKLKKSRQEFAKIKDFEKLIRPVLYRPFDTRYVWYFNSKILLERIRWNVMRHIIAGENVGIITSRQTHGEFRHVFITTNVTNLNATGTAGSFGSGYIFPLYLYPDIEKKDLFSDLQENKERQVNINKKIYDKLTKTYGAEPTPEEILYYIYSIFYSNIYRKKYAEFLKIDFPRVPFTKDYKLFKQMTDIGEELAGLHLLKSKLLNKTVSKFEGEGDNLTIKKASYNPENQQVFINKNKYFTNIYPELWNYYIGGYQVLSKWLKDRKDRQLTTNEIQHYIKTATALHYTIELQKKIDEIYTLIETSLIF